jgi:glycosyltransferase involved in cell wall biosynthesis
VSVHVGIFGQALHERLAQCDAFVFPSLSEGSALVLLEALACGLPVIATPNAGGGGIVVEGEIGFTVPAHDQGALTARLAWCLENRAALHQMGLRAQERAAIFTWERFREQVRDSVASLVTG